MNGPHAIPRPAAAAPEDAVLRLADGRYAGQFRGLTLHSAFQPIFSLAHRRVVGYEALLRARDGEDGAVSPFAAFALARDEAETVHLDRLCRGVHVHNFAAPADSGAWLFLNVSPQVVVHGRAYGAFFEAMLKRRAFPPQRLVVEILEEEIRDEAMLADAVAYYRGLGCLVAIDDFGAGHSNFDRIWRIAPDIVKLDRAMTVQAAESARVRRVMPNLVGLLHQSGSLVLMEGVETEEEALIGMEAGIDLMQGYYFGRPAPCPCGNGEALEALERRFAHYSHSERDRHRDQLAPYVETFLRAAGRLAKKEITWEGACAALFTLPQTTRLFILDDAGRQWGDSVLAPGRQPAEDARFTPLADGGGAVWSRRRYFIEALERPGEIQVSRPYLSITGAGMCVTLSLLFQQGGESRVFCCDLDWRNS
ncbi:MAG TPA: EAL domain-containing protein [Betaproteobacteria bacterium]|nr:EAL domain-containing protein [Betaproteobacteria bacterium]